MCIAIYKPAGAWATKRQLRQCFKRNPDGAGYAWLRKDGQLVLRKGFFSWRMFWKCFKRDVTTENPAFIHFRIATKGKHDADRCHPFLMEHGVLMHNGPCLNYKACSGDGDRSDTQQFVEDFVDGLTSKQFKRLKPMIEDFAGTEKVAAMFDDGEVVICNESYGHWDEGIWWSNYSYKDYKSHTGEVTGTEATSTNVIKPATRWGDHWKDWEDEDAGFFYSRNFASSAYDDEVWSPSLKLHLKKQLTITDDTYEWDESMRAYIKLAFKDSLTLFPISEEGVVYGAIDDGNYDEVGFLVDSSADYYELYWSSEECRFTAATA